jgi:hypothetical protein
MYIYIYLDILMMLRSGRMRLRSGTVLAQLSSSTLPGAKKREEQEVDIYNLRPDLLECYLRQLTRVTVSALSSSDEEVLLPLRGKKKKKSIDTRRKKSTVVRVLPERLEETSEVSSDDGIRWRSRPWTSTM